MRKLMILLMSFTIILFTSCGVNVEDIVNKFDEDKVAAIEEYNKLSKSQSEKVDNIISERIKKIYEEFENGDVEKSSAIKDIFKYSGVAGVKELISETRDNISILATSEQSYRSAEENYKKGYYGIASSQYEEVDSISKYYEDAQKKLAICKDAINNNNELKKNIEPYIGMLESEIDICTWGRPNKINETITAYGVSKQYVYSGYKYLYFDDGVLTAIQK